MPFKKVLTLVLILSSLMAAGCQAGIRVEEAPVEGVPVEGGSGGGQKVPISGRIVMPSSDQGQGR